MENLQTKSEKQYYIPMEVNEASKEIFIANGYDLSTDAVWTKIGHRTVRAIMIPATKEQYLEYMRPLWREDKQAQRASKQEDKRKMLPVSLNQLYEDTEYEMSDGADLEENFIKQEMLKELHAALDELEEIDRIIMKMFGDGATEKQIAEVVHLSQKGVNKRNVWDPKSINGGTPKYSVSLIIPKSDVATVKKIEAAIQAAYEEGESKLKGSSKSVPSLKVLKTPLRDGDLERPDDAAYADSYFINANSASAPGIVDADRQPILERSEVYSGVYGRASINFYAFNSNGNKGIACGLNNLQKIADGEPLGGKSRAEDDFATDDDDDFLS